MHASEWYCPGFYCPYCGCDTLRQNANGMWECEDCSNEFLEEEAEKPL